MTGTFKGVPSTGQKLNLSANSSLQVEQNFIVTTSFWLWGNSAEDWAAGISVFKLHIITVCDS